jgi:orotidine-5'-phosphate decarboxylase
MKKNQAQIYLALDQMNEHEISNFLEKLELTPDIQKKVGLKIGLELFYLAGRSIVEKFAQENFSIFLDLKLHDIPQTVHQALLALKDLPLSHINVHATGGEDMLRKAVDAVQKFSHPTQLLAVTILTSLDQRNITSELKMSLPLPEMVTHLASLAQKAGCDGVVCSAQEASLLRQTCGPNYFLMTPGIRLTESTSDDQKRVMTPEAAFQFGSSAIVIGRPLTQSQNPAQTLRTLCQNLP